MKATFEAKIRNIEAKPRSPLTFSQSIESIRNLKMRIFNSISSNPDLASFANYRPKVKVLRQLYSLTKNFVLKNQP